RRWLGWSVVGSVRVASMWLKTPRWRMCRLAIWGQPSRALAARRCCRDAFVESGYLTTAIIFPGGMRLRRVAAGPGRVRHKDQMPVPSPYLIVLSAEEEAVLAAGARSVRSQYRDRLRAQIVLAAAAGMNNAAIAGQLGVHVDTVRKWRRRFA